MSYISNFMTMKRVTMSATILFDLLKARDFGIYVKKICIVGQPTSL